MLTRRPLGLPILLAIMMIVMLILLSVGWVIMAVRSALYHSARAPVYLTMLSVGALFVRLVGGIG